MFLPKITEFNGCSVLVLYVFVKAGLTGNQSVTLDRTHKHDFN